MRRRIKPAYLLFLVIPLLYYYIKESNPLQKPAKQQDYFYFSVRSTGRAIISFFTSKDSLYSWEVNSTGYKYIDYAGKLPDTSTLKLKVRNLKEKDTVIFLAFNLYHNNHITSLYDHISPFCLIDNANKIEKDNAVYLVPRQALSPIVVRLKDSSAWKLTDVNHRFDTLLIFIFLFAFLIVLAFAPSPRYFAVSCVLSLLLLVFLYYTGRNEHYKVTFSNTSPVKRFETFYSNSPCFNSVKRFSKDSIASSFSCSLDLENDSCIRCDIDGCNNLTDVHFRISSGLLSFGKNLANVPLGKLLLNDLLLRNDKFYITGPDPHFVFTSTYFSNRIHFLVQLRRNLFLFLTLIIFLIIISLHFFLEKIKPVSFFLTTAFLAIISGGILLWLFNSDRLIMNTEKRSAAKLPFFNADSSDAFIHGLEAYLKDQLPGRDWFITMNNLAKYSVFHEFDNPFVHFGKDGWMFYTGENAREMYENRYPLTMQELEKMKDVMLARRDWLNKRGIKFYIIFPPMSHFVYEEKMGDGLFRHNKKTKLQQLLQYLKQHTDLNIIDVSTPIAEAKKKYMRYLYYKTDVHWNYFGAYFAYAAIINRLRSDFPAIGELEPLQNIKWMEKENDDADLVKMLSLTGYIGRHEYIPVYRQFGAATDTVHPLYPEYTSPYAALFVVNDSVRSPSMLMFHDSYANYLKPYLAWHFSRSAYLWSPVFYPTIVAKEKPDIVIWEMAEHRIYDLLAKNPPLEIGKE